MIVAQLRGATFAPDMETVPRRFIAPRLGGDLMSHSIAIEALKDVAAWLDYDWDTYVSALPRLRGRIFDRAKRSRS